jgi:uncharacterized protein YdeI (YjbR/CyaY-like superfamily)
MKPRFFRSGEDFRAWLGKHAASSTELWLGYHKRGSDKASVTWPESVDHALCFGWIDGVRKSIDARSYVIRFTPRKSSSTWSAVNIKRVASLRKQGLMQPAGLAAFGARREKRSSIYSYEQPSMELAEPYAGMLKKSVVASTFFAAQPASYRKAAIWWVINAKQESTRLRRLDQLITDSQRHRRLERFSPRRAKT